MAWGRLQRVAKREPGALGQPGALGRPQSPSATAGALATADQAPGANTGPDAGAHPEPTPRTPRRRRPAPEPTPEPTAGPTPPPFRLRRGPSDPQSFSASPAPSTTPFPAAALTGTLDFDERPPHRRTPSRCRRSSVQGTATGHRELDSSASSRVQAPGQKPVRVRSLARSPGNATRVGVNTFPDRDRRRAERLGHDPQRVPVITDGAPTRRTIDQALELSDQTCLPRARSRRRTVPRRRDRSIPRRRTSLAVLMDAGSSRRRIESRHAGSTGGLPIAYKVPFSPTK